MPMAIVLATRRFSGAFSPAGTGAAPGAAAGGRRYHAISTFGRQGALGQRTEAFDYRIAFTTAAWWCWLKFRLLPFLVMSLRRGLRSPPTSTSIAAMLGGLPTTVLPITLPLVLPGLISGAVLAFCAIPRRVRRDPSRVSWASPHALPLEIIFSVRPIGRRHRAVTAADRGWYVSSYSHPDDSPARCERPSTPGPPARARRRIRPRLSSGDVARGHGARLAQASRRCCP